MTLELVLLAAVLVAGGAATYALTRRRKQVWRRFAARHGLELRAGTPPSASGEVAGRRITLTSAPESSDEGLLGEREVELAVELRTPSLTGLVVTHRTFADPLAGASGLLTGDAELDELARVTGPAEEVREYLTPRRRRALVRLLTISPSAIAGLENGRVFVREHRAVADLRLLERQLSELLAIAVELDG